MDEVIGYDWNVFLADIGGSLGFLLGLSVIGAITLVEQIVLLLFMRKPKKQENKEVNNEKEKEANKCKEKMVPEILITNGEMDEKSLNNYSVNLLTKENNNEKSQMIDKY